MAARAAFAACVTSYHPTTEPMQELTALEMQELVLSVLYRLSAYAVINLIDDAAMLSLVFV